MTRFRPVRVAVGAPGDPSPGALVVSMFEHAHGRDRMLPGGEPWADPGLVGMNMP